MLKENLVRKLEGSIRKQWANPSLGDYRGKAYSYGEVGGRILRMHHLFSALGIEKGDKVSVLGRNCANWAVTYLATVSYGAVIVPILPDFKPSEVHHIVNHSDSRLLFVADNIFDNIDEEKMTGLKAIFSLGSMELLFSAGNETDSLVGNSKTGYVESYGHIEAENFTLPEVENSELAAIVYTSGTTGFSKGAMLSHNALIANIEYYIENLPINEGDTVLSFLPLAHAFGCAFEFLSPFVKGCHITFLGKTPTPKVVVRAFNEVKPRVVLSVPLIIEKIYRNQIKPFLEKRRGRLLMRVPLINTLVRRKIREKLVGAFGGNIIEVVIGGAALNRDVEKFFRKIGFPFSLGYGMTECGPLISYANHKKQRLQSVGEPIDFLELKIGEPDPETGVGEILVKGENVMEGYYKDAKATSEVLIDGWLRTGDIGRLDKNGYLYLTGRSKNMILGSSGQNIFPEEIESVLNNLPYVVESIVLPHEKKLVALVHPDFDLADQDGITKENLEAIMEENREELNKRIPSYSSVSAIKIYPEEFEKTPTKKIKRMLYTVLS